MKNVYIGDSFCLEVSVELFTPFLKECVAGSEQSICFLLWLKITFQKFLFKFVGSLVVSDLSLELMICSFNFKNSSLEFRNFIIEGVLLWSISILKFFNFFSVQFSETADLI